MGVFGPCPDHKNRPKNFFDGATVPPNNFFSGGTVNSINDLNDHPVCCFYIGVRNRLVKQGENPKRKCCQLNIYI